MQDPANDDMVMSKLRTAAEKAKKDLSVEEVVEVKVLGLWEGKDLLVSLTRQKLERLIRVFLNNFQGSAAILSSLFVTCFSLVVVDAAIDDAEEAGITSFDRVLLVGGSTKIPAIRRKAKELLGVEPEFLNVDTIVSLGAALQAYILQQQRTEQHQNARDAALEREEEKKKPIFGLPVDFCPVIGDIVPRSVGIMLQDGSMSVILPAKVSEVMRVCGAFCNSFQKIDEASLQVHKNVHKC